VVDHLDQIANDLKIFLNIDISHQTIKNMLQFDFKQVEYYEETVKANKEKQSNNGLKTGEYDKIFVVKKKNPEIMGYLVVDELFITINKKRWYCVCFHDILNQNVPFAVGLVKRRTLENMTRIYEISTRGMEITALTSDHFKVYESIADEKEIIHQECIFHHFNNLNDDIYPFLKDESISDIEKMVLARQTSEYRNIFREFDEKKSKLLWDSFLNNEKPLHDVFIDNSEKITEHFLSHTQFTRDNFIPRTSNQAEKFHSLPVIRQIKNSAQTPKGFLECMAVIIQYYKPKTRKRKRP
jgi:IS1 family transposase